MTPNRRHPSWTGMLPLLVLVGACSITEPIGRAFPRPEAAPGIVIGQSNEADIVAVYGQPTRRVETGSAVPPDPKLAATFKPSTDTILVYQNGRKVVLAYAAPYTTLLRTVTLRLHDGVLAGYGFASALPEDAQSFDTGAAESLLKRPDATLPDLIAAIGPPQSREVFQQASPAAAIAETDTWNGTVRNASGRVVEAQSLVVSLGRDGKVMRHTLSDTVTP